MRGGTYLKRKVTQRLQGLSPHARGNRRWTTKCCYDLGSIPACAGEPRQGDVANTVGEVYPRMRGGTKAAIDTCCPYSGLSPHARGNHCSPVSVGVLIGSIPACAGEPTAVATQVTALGVYPRMRGGTEIDAFPIVQNWGLSPHARGNHRRWIELAPSTGSIPACAGEPHSKS